MSTLYPPAGSCKLMRTKTYAKTLQLIIDTDKTKLQSHFCYFFPF
jgi:hypothetical protein